MKVAGLDISLNTTTYAGPSGLHRCAPGKLRGVERIYNVTLQVQMRVAQDGLDAVLVEGPSFGSRTSMQHEMGGMWWSVVGMLRQFEDLEVWMMPPASLKKYATGNGNAAKIDMVIAARDRLGYEGKDDNEADALWLEQACADHVSVDGFEARVPLAWRASLTNITETP